MGNYHKIIGSGFLQNPINYECNINNEWSHVIYTGEQIISVFSHPVI